MVLALMAVAPAFAAYNTSSTDGYYTSGATRANTTKTTTTTRKNGGYNNTIQNNFYYSQPKSSSYEVMPRQNTQRTSYSSRYDNVKYDTRYDDRGYDSGYTVREKQVTTRTYTTQERKYFLAHPFFQPLKGKFGSVTDVSYAANDFRFEMLNGTVIGLNPYDDSANISGPLDPIVTGKSESTQFLVKEDVSIGITDTLAVIGMLQYDRTKITLKDWSEPDVGKNTYTSQGLHLFGIGLQNRFVDNDDWIAMIAGYFQHQKDTANTFIGELKVGYKVDRTTIYGLGRGGYSYLTDGDIYGSYVEDNGDYMMLSYKTDVKDVVYVEGGLGMFAVLNKYFTLNGELLYGYYDWHDQLSIKGALGIQPGDMFALNIYGSMAVYDSAKNKTNKYMSYDVNPTAYPVDADNNPVYTNSQALYTTGDYRIKDYNEWKVGVQAILYF